MKGKTFLNRTIYDDKTRKWYFPDGSGVVPDEMRIDMEMASENRNRAGCNGMSVLGTLWKWKERLTRITKKRD